MQKVRKASTEQNLFLYITHQDVGFLLNDEVCDKSSIVP